jgi:hypothetical protein
MYRTHKVNLSSNQKRKLLSAIKKKHPVNLKLNYNQLQNGNDTIKLTDRQIHKIRKASAARTGTVLKVSTKQIKQSGGFLPLLLPLLGALGGLAGGAASIAKAVSDTKTNKAKVEEEKRHNLAMEGKGLKKKKKGKGRGLFIKPYVGKGKGLHLKPYVGKGKGFQLKPPSRR